VRQLDAAGLRAEDVGVRRPTLDEVFLDRTGGARTGSGEPDPETSTDETSTEETETVA
jgi:ABC-2 type transport system ATP-binding protein